MRWSVDATWLYFVLASNGEIYVGVAKNPIARYRMHAAGRGARFLSMHPPASLLGAVLCASRSVALSLEYTVKRAGRSKKLSFALLAAHDPIWMHFASSNGWPKFVYRVSSD